MAQYLYKFWYATGETVVLENVWLFEVAGGRLASAQLYADTAAVRSSAA